MYIALFFFIAAVCVVLYKGCHIVLPTQRGVIESLGRYKWFAEPGFHWVLPLSGKLRVVSISDQLLDTEEQLTITSDNISVVIGAQVYFRIRPDEASVKAALYNTERYDKQTLALTRSALKNIVGKLPLRRLSGGRDFVKTELCRLLEASTVNWGIEILRVELQDIEFPRDVQESFNNVIKAENGKKAADSQKRAKILTAEGEAQATKLADLAK